MIYFDPSNCMRADEGVLATEFLHRSLKSMFDDGDPDLLLLYLCDEGANIRWSCNMDQTWTWQEWGPLLPNPVDQVFTLSRPQSLELKFSDWDLVSG